MKKVLIVLLLVILVLLKYNSSTPPTVLADQCGVKCPSQSDPNRPYYDLWGNKFSWDGTLIKLGKCNANNPYCPTKLPKTVISGK